MGRARQTFERRQLGLTLRRLREEAGLTQQAAAEAIGRVRSRIVELEEGKGTLSQQDLTNLLNGYGVSEAQRKTVLALGAQARKRHRGGTHTDLLPDSYQRFADLEASATEICNFESGLIPGLLQSPGYVRAIMNECDGIWWERSATELDERITFRLDRQTKVWGAGRLKSARFIIAEQALRAAVQEPAIMREQLWHLVNLEAQHPALTFQVLPSETHSNPARGGSFQIFGFEGHASALGVSTVVFGPDVYLDDPSDTAALQRAFEHLSQLALRPEESRLLIHDIAKAR